MRLFANLQSDEYGFLDDALLHQTDFKCSF